MCRVERLIIQKIIVKILRLTKVTSYTIAYTVAVFDVVGLTDYVEVSLTFCIIRDTLS